MFFVSLTLDSLCLIEGSIFKLLFIDFSSCSIVGRVKDTFKTPEGRQVSPFQVEDVLLSEPQGLISDAIVAGVVPGLGYDDGKIARAWIVLSDEGKKLGADVVIKELEVWYQKRLSNHKWLHGGFEIVDEVRTALIVYILSSFLIQIFIVDSEVDIGQTVKSSIAEKSMESVRLSRQH